MVERGCKYYRDYRNWASMAGNYDGSNKIRPIACSKPHSFVGCCYAVICKCFCGPSSDSLCIGGIRRNSARLSLQMQFSRRGLKFSKHSILRVPLVNLIFLMFDRVIPLCLNFCLEFSVQSRL